MGRTAKSLAAVLRDTAGSLLPIAAIGMIVAVIIVGSAIDLSRAYRVKNQLQAACDAAVLAGRRTVTTNGYDTASQTAATTYFAANFLDADQDTHGTAFSSSTPDSGSTVNGTASTIMDTVVMRLFGFTTIPLNATCASSMGVGNADVMMVLDTTGSMTSSLGNTTRIAALRSAMKNFYTTLQSATSGTNARIRYGFVPYSSTVNVGSLLYAANPSYLVDSYTYPSRKYVVDGPTTSTSNASSSDWTKYSNTSYSTLSNCQKSLPSNDSAYSNYGSSSTSSSTSNGVTTTTVSQPQRKYAYQCQSVTTSSSNCRYNCSTTTVYYIYYMYYSQTSSSVTKTYYQYQQITYDTSKYKTFSAVSTPTGTNGAAVSSTWGGCIQERSTVAAASFSYSSTTGLSPSGALDLDIDSAPTSDASTKWAPMWPEVAYQRWNNSNYYDTATTTNGRSVQSIGYTFCPQKAQLLSEMTQSAFNSYADSLSPEGSTYLDIGLIWGGRLASPTGIFASNVNTAPSNGGEVSRHLIFMTDGEMEPNYLIQQAWGMEYWDRNVTSNGYTDDEARHTSRFRAACDVIKAKGIRIWVIAFTSDLSDDLSYCASDDSSYSATDAAGLNTAFQEIAKQVGELRIVQ